MTPSEPASTPAARSIDLRTPLSLRTAFLFPLQSPLARREVLHGAVLVLVPVVGWILNMGHRIAMVHRMQQGLSAWPAWRGYGALFRHGLLTLLGMVMYYAPSAVCGFLAWRWTEPSLWAAAAILWLAATAAIPGYMSHYCTRFDVREIFDPARALRRVGQGGSAYAKAWGISACALAVSLTGLLAAGVGFLLTSVWFWQVAGYAFATVFTQRFDLRARPEGSLAAAAPARAEVSPAPPPSGYPHGMRCLLAAGLLILSSCSRSDSGRDEAHRSLEGVAPAASLMAADFFDAFANDPSAAAATHAGKVVELTGVFLSWTLVDRAGGGSKAAKDITLLSHGRSENALFVLDREVMDRKYMIVDYFSLIRMKGRYAGRDGDKTFRFTDSVLTTTRPLVRDYPTAAVVSAEDLAGAFWPPGDGTEGRRYSGRVVEVTGAVQGFEERELLLRAVDESQPVRCHLEEGVEAFRKTHEEGRPVRLKGFCAGHIAGTRGVTLEGCVVP